MFEQKVLPIVPAGSNHTGNGVLGQFDVVNDFANGRRRGEKCLKEANCIETDVLVQLAHLCQHVVGRDVAFQFHKIFAKTLFTFNKVFFSYIYQLFLKIQISQAALKWTVQKLLFSGFNSMFWFISLYLTLKITVGQKVKGV